MNIGQYHLSLKFIKNNQMSATYNHLIYWGANRLNKSLPIFYHQIRHQTI